MAVGHKEKYGAGCFPEACASCCHVELIAAKASVLPSFDQSWG